MQIRPSSMVFSAFCSIRARARFVGYNPDKNGRTLFRRVPFRRGWGTYATGTALKFTPNGVLTALLSFDSSSGGPGATGLVRGTDGDFYGTTSFGGLNGEGTVFELTTDGTLTTLYSFGGTDGTHCEASLLLASDGNFYGLTTEGDAKGYGTVFEITPAGAKTTLTSFDGRYGVALWPASSKEAMRSMVQTVASRMLV